MKKNNIILIGFMGTGKTAVGTLLAEKLGYSFVDTDQMIEAEAAMSITEIFEKHGEEYFRELETRGVIAACAFQNCVIATGGGVVLREENMSALSAHGKIICLHAEIEKIHERTSSTDHRPLLQGEDPLKLIRERLQNRRHLYVGELNLDTTHISIEEAAARIISYLDCPPEFECLKLNAASGSYDIAVCSDMFEVLPKNLRPVVKSKKMLLVCSAAVSVLWAKKVEKCLQPHFEVHTHIVPDGEEYKNFESAMKIFSKALEIGLDRTSTIIAVGGGVIGDLAGFVASTYMRGIRVVQVPTTLLAQVDSSIGGKTGINHPQGKNIIGTFHQPSLVFSDISTLMTLPKAELVNGMAEVIKYGMIMDGDLFEFLESHVEKLLSFDPEKLLEIVMKCSYHKKRIVEMDERESGIRAILNYGHTIGHGIEAASNYKGYRHGEAVAIGMDYAARLSVSRGLLTERDLLRQRRLLEAFGLPTEFEGLDASLIYSTLLNDKKNENGKIRMILPERIGSAKLWDNITQEEIKSILKIM